MEDSRASFHATPHGRFFTTCKKENFGMVKIKNYGKSKVIDIGDVKFVTNLNYNLILKNVHHVSDLRLNLVLASD